jgi:hypothetical protein
VYFNPHIFISGLRISAAADVESTVLWDVTQFYWAAQPNIPEDRTLHILREQKDFEPNGSEHSLNLICCFSKFIVNIYFDFQVLAH